MMNEDALNAEKKVILHINALVPLKEEDPCLIPGLHLHKVDQEAEVEAKPINQDQDHEQVLMNCYNK